MSSDRGAPTGMWETKPSHLEERVRAPDMTKIKAFLKVTRPDLPTVEIPIEKPEFVIGRDVEQVDLVLDDDLVSRQHAKLVFSSTGYVSLTDLDSKNGIEFQGRTVRRLNLVQGDEFAIGKARFEFHADIQRFRAMSNASAEALEAVDAQAPMEAEMSLLAEDIPEPRSQSSDED